MAGGVGELVKRLLAEREVEEQAKQAARRARAAARRLAVKARQQELHRYLWGDSPQR
jgi:hypothetical protein